MLQASSPVKLPSSPDSFFPINMSTSPKYHTYSLGIIALALDLASHAGLGNRKVVEVLKVLNKYLGTFDRLPSYNTVRDWVAKRGYYQLSELRCATGPSATWAIIVDVSIRVGGQRLLLVLGVNLKEYNFDRPLAFSDVRVLSLGLRHEKSWSGAAIKSHLKKHVLKYYKVVYLVSDSGPGIKLAARELGLPRIDDVSHAFARILKREYNHRSDFEAFIKKCTHVRRYNTINPDSHLRPPQLRGTARFMNVAPLIKWATGMLEVLDHEGVTYYKGKSFTARHRAKVAWLLELRAFVGQLAATLKMTDKISQWIKCHGLSIQTVAWAKISLENNPQRSLINRSVYQEILGYLDGELIKVGQLELPTVICSTDVIESFFGKYKESIPKVAMVNSHTLRIVTYGQEIQSMAQVKKMMEYTNLKQLRLWRDQQLNQDQLLLGNCSKQVA